jgi:hypothetical protein
MNGDSSLHPLEGTSNVIGVRVAHAQAPAGTALDREARSFAWRPVRPARRVLLTLWDWAYFDALALGLLVVSITALNLLWVSLDSRPPQWDMARHLGDSLYYQTTFSLSNPLHPLEAYTWYPPFVYWVTDLFYAILGTATWVAILSNAVFIAVLAFATYGIGKTLWNRRVGLLSALFVLTTPMVINHFKWYMLDAPLAAMVALALYLLIRSENFARRNPTLLFGVVCGLGLLTKWTFPLFLALPALVAALTAIKESVLRRSAQSLVNLLLAGFLAAAVCGVWVIHNYAHLRRDLAFNSTQAGVIQGAPVVGSLASLLWYFWTLVNAQLYAIPFLFLAVGIVFLFKKDESASKNFYPVLTIVGTYIAFTLLRNKAMRFTIPVLPAVAVVAVHWLEYLTLRVRRWVTAGIAVYGVATFLVISFGTSLLPKEIAIRFGAHSYSSNLLTYTPDGNSTYIRGITFFAQHGEVVGPPSSEKWYQQQVFEQIAGEGEQPTFWYQGPDSIWFNTWGTRYYSLKYHETWVATPDQANFLVIRGVSGSPIPGGFAEIARYRLPDGEPLSLYKRT